MLEGNVLLTGGAGFWGRAVLRRAHREKWPTRFTIYSRDETKQWNVAHRYPDVRCVLGDVRDEERLSAVMAGMDYVCHAGAVKYIPEAEHNVLETIAVNVRGSEIVARTAAKAGVKTVVGISTDKACAPANTYGATKMLMERAFAEANRWSGTRFVTVRYGNVVGSTGSVIPFFQDQVRTDRVITVTDKEMTRFWLGVDEAIDLVLDAFLMAHERPGVTLIGANPAMRIYDLAAAIWQLHSERAGWQGQATIPNIKIIGQRPGEKIHESLYDWQEAPRARWSDATEGARIVLYPAVGGARMKDSLTVSENGYRSDDPIRWLSREEMIAMIKDAEGV